MSNFDYGKIEQILQSNNNNADNSQYENIVSFVQSVATKIISNQEEIFKSINDLKESVSNNELTKVLMSKIDYIINFMPVNIGSLPIFKAVNPEVNDSFVLFNTDGDLLKQSINGKFRMIFNNLSFDNLPVEIKININNVNLKYDSKAINISDLEIDKPYVCEIIDDFIYVDLDKSNGTTDVSEYVKSDDVVYEQKKGLFGKKQKFVQTKK